MNRRLFLRISGLASIEMLASRRAFQQSSSEGRLMTVLGPISPAELGSTLAHEHVLVDFIGAQRITPERYDADEVFEVVLPYLRRVKDLGGHALVECTPAYLGRDPRLLARLARAARLHILTNTGYYGAAKDQYVPRHAYQETAEQLAERWAAEWRAGIDRTGIRPGFIKTGVDAGPLSDIDKKLIQAAARTHLRTGLTIASHTGDTRSGHEQLDILAAEGVRPDGLIWVHAQSDWEPRSRIRAAEKGTWIEIDNIADGTVRECVSRVSELKEQGVLRRVLVSQDAGWYRPGEPRGGSFRGFETLYTAFVPALRTAGWSEGEVHQLLVVNPAAAFTVAKRPAA